MRTKKYLFVIFFLALGMFCFLSTFEYEITPIETIYNQIVSPSPRSGHNMVYDPVNHKVILFGGRSSEVQLLDDTWAYDYTTNTWTELQPAVSPPSRSEPAMAYDSSNQKVVLFGGWGGEELNDTWIYDYGTNNWTQVFPEAAPPTRMSSAMIYDAVNEKMILFGGYGANLFGDDTWVYDYTSNTWNEMQPIAYPEFRYGHTMVYDSLNEICILVGGNGEGRDDTWTYNYSSNIWVEMTPHQHPSPRYWHMMTYDSTNHKVILFGGSSFSVDLADIWVYDYSLNEWSYLPTSIAPNPRSLSALVYDSVNQKTILFGGGNEDHILMNDTWAYDYPTNSWIGMIASPSSTFIPSTSTSTSSTSPFLTTSSTTSIHSTGIGLFTIEIFITTIGISGVLVWRRRKKAKG